MFHTHKHTDNRLFVRVSKINCLDNVKQYLIGEIISIFSVIFSSLILFGSIVWYFSVSKKLNKNVYMFLRILPLAFYAI